MKTTQIIEAALAERRTVLTENEGKQILAEYGVPVSREVVTKQLDQALAAANELGYPVVLKGMGSAFNHKSELGLVRLSISTAEELEKNFAELQKVMQDEGLVLVQETVKGKRELMGGMIRDDQFGPVVTFGLGGIFAEALNDISLRVAPLDEYALTDMMDEIRASALLGPVRGLMPVDRQSLGRTLQALGQIALDHDQVREIDINPLIVRNGVPTAVDALIILSD